MTQLDIFPTPPDPVPSPNMILFETNSASHDAWMRFVTSKGMRLGEIVSWLRDTYQAEFGVSNKYWWIQFPDLDSRQEFELTWM